MVHGSCMDLGRLRMLVFFFSLLPAEIPVCELVCSVFFMPFEAAGHVEVMDLDLFKPGLVSFTSSI